jgi:hypothetical protein|tara:strand:- start:415 stop:1176 length:762 start_codon:yes stop_codon:yes gene_type:complete
MANDKPKKSTFRKVVDYARANPGEAAATALMVVPIGGWAVGGAIRGGLAARKAYKARKFIGAKIKKKAVAAGKKVAKYTQKPYRAAADKIGPAHKQAGKKFTTRGSAEKARKMGKQASFRHKTMRLKDKTTTITTKANKKKGIKGSTRTYTTKQYGIRPSAAGVATSKTASLTYGGIGYYKSQGKSQPKEKLKAEVKPSSGGSGNKVVTPKPKYNPGTYSKQSQQHSSGSIRGSRLSNFQKTVKQNRKRLEKY